MGYNDKQKPSGSFTWYSKSESGAFDYVGSVGEVGSEAASLRKTLELRSKILLFKMWSLDGLSGHHLRVC